MGGHVGDYTYIMGQTCIAYANIGKFCSIGEHCSIGGWEHPYKLISDSPRLYREILDIEYDDLNSSVVIENDVWIGDNAVIINGTIGTGSIIAQELSYARCTTICDSCGKSWSYYRL